MRRTPSPRTLKALLFAEARGRRRARTGGGMSRTTTTTIAEGARWHAPVSGSFVMHVYLSLF